MSEPIQSTPTADVAISVGRHDGQYDPEDHSNSMSQTAESPVLAAVRTLERELETARRERDEFRDRWLKQVDINDKLRAELAYEKVRL